MQEKGPAGRHASVEPSAVGPCTLIDQEELITSLVQVQINVLVLMCFSFIATAGLQGSVLLMFLSETHHLP